ncbi:MAG: extracellular solute-binding protein [Gammaproteobacteria bacterium]|nr:extracellular solute-binding protein [Gammaproteobacteria bacterium]
MSNRHHHSISRRGLLKYSAATGALGTLGASGILSQALAATGTVNFMAWSAAVDLVKSHVAEFEKATGINVDYANAPWAQYRESLITKFTGGAPLDMMWVSDAWLPEWADAGWIKPIDGFDSLMKYNDETEQFCIDSMTYKGRQYGLTYYTDFMAFLYDDAALKKAGISAPPQTWDEVTEQCLKIKQAGISEYPLMLALAKESWLIEFQAAMVYSNGGRFTDDAGASVMQSPAEGAVKAVQWAVDAVHKHKIVSPACVETGELAGLKAFGGGNHAFALLPKYRMRTLNDPAQSQIAGRAKQALMPKGEGGSHATVGWMRFHGMSAAAAADPKQAELTAKLIEWFGGKANGEYRFQKYLFTDIGAAFGVKPLFDDPDVQAAYNSYADVEIIKEQQALARQKDVVTPWFGEWQEVHGAAWQSAILGDVSAEEATAKAGAKWDDLKKEFS